MPYEQALGDTYAHLRIVLNGSEKIFPAVWGDVVPSEYVRKIEDPSADEEWTVTR